MQRQGVGKRYASPRPEEKECTHKRLRCALCFCILCAVPAAKPRWSLVCKQPGGHAWGGCAGTEPLLPGLSVLIKFTQAAMKGRKVGWELRARRSDANSFTSGLRAGSARCMHA